MIPKRFRLNIVGGEPVLQPEKLWNVVKTAKKYGAEVSMITNGSHLEVIRPFAHMISRVGISIDSFYPETNIKIGRACNGETLFFEDLEEKIRTFHPKMIYTIPTFQNPTGCTLGLERRKKIAALAEEYGVVVAEDDPYHDLRYTGRELPTIKSFDKAQVRMGGLPGQLFQGHFPGHAGGLPGRGAGHPAQVRDRQAGL